jgi:membrane protein YdbS with pleckstrin-like domain
MKVQSTPREVFRRSWLTMACETGLALCVSSMVLWSYHQFGLRGQWAGLGLAVLPIAWVVARTTQWACRTWMATADGRLIVQEGVLFRTRQVIHLCSARNVRAEAPLLTRWLGIGHLTLRATDCQGQLRLFRWTWLGQYLRLYEIVQAQGHLSVGRPSRWQLVGSAVENLACAVGMRVMQGWAFGGEVVARLQGCWFVDDYGRFMAFCRHLLRTTRQGRPPPSWVPPAVARRWMTLLRQAHIVVDVPNGGGWRIAGAIHSLEDVCRRIGEDELQRSLQRPVGPALRRRKIV